jgi:hypothetical protein
MTVRTEIAIGIALVVNAVLLCAGVLLILSAAGLNERAVVLLPLVVLISFILAPMISAWLAAHTDTEASSGTSHDQKIGRRPKD